MSIFKYIIILNKIFKYNLNLFKFNSHIIPSVFIMIRKRISIQLPFSPVKAPKRFENAQKSAVNKIYNCVPRLRKKEDRFRYPLRSPAIAREKTSVQRSENFCARVYVRTRKTRPSRIASFPNEPRSKRSRATTHHRSNIIPCEQTRGYRSSELT